MGMSDFLDNFDVKSKLYRLLLVITIVIILLVLALNRCLNNESNTLTNTGDTQEIRTSVISGL
jgi:hypothetical protein